MKVEYYEEMLEQEAINRYLNMIANYYNGELARIFEEKYINKDKEIERLNNIIKEVREILKFHLSNPSGTKNGWHIDIWNSEDISKLNEHLEILDKGE